MPSTREILIGLNAQTNLPRPDLPRLAAGLDRWFELAAPSAATVAEIAAELGVSRETLRRARQGRRQLAEIARRELASAHTLGARIAVAGEDGYPSALLELADPPLVLASRGAPPVDGPAVALVGARRADLYGLEVARFLGRHLAAGGATVVSGLARGVDGDAHRGALDGDGAGTIAVLGCGLCLCYPPHHRSLAERIVAAGSTLASELPFEAPPLARHFPIRNRIIAALAQAVVIVQAAPRSGSLVTARLALELGREVLAVPGPIFSELSLGPNALLRDGARPALHPDDVLESIGLDPRAPAPAGSEASSPAIETRKGLAGPAQPLLQLLAVGSGAVPEVLANRLDLPLEQVLVLLLELELDGRIVREQGGRWRRRARVVA